ncbi:hypothetical protein C8J57DRAFT_1373219 [Mycena rebaudengoi]|nr:hypothetical protein C8J57DRAFT_1373219 [Mycena rebaudengoi]
MEREIPWPNAGLYRLRMAIVKLEPGVNVHDTPENASKYSFVGDIKDLTLLEEASGQGWCIDPRERVYARVCGVVIEDDKKKATFTMDAEQYTSSFADLAKQAAQDPKITAQKSIFPIFGYIPDSPRFGTKKPVPFAKKFTSFGGYLVGLSSELEGEKLIECFRIEVDTIALGLGTFVPMAVSTPASASIASTSSTSNKRGWSYDAVSGPRAKRGKKGDDDDDTAPSSSPSPFIRTH